MVAPMRSPFRNVDPVVYIDSQDCILWMVDLTNEQVGETFQEMAHQLMNGRVEWVRSLPFVKRVNLRASFRDRIPSEVREEVLSAGKCAVCPSTENLEVDHIVPLSRDGTNARENLQCLCITCNRQKGTKTMEEWLP